MHESATRCDATDKENTRAACSHTSRLSRQRRDTSRAVDSTGQILIDVSGNEGASDVN
jgi:hypothetical protein